MTTFNPQGSHSEQPMMPDFPYSALPVIKGLDIEASLNRNYQQIDEMIDYLQTLRGRSHNEMIDGPYSERKHEDVRACLRSACEKIEANLQNIEYWERYVGRQLIDQQQKAQK